MRGSKQSHSRLTPPGPGEKMAVRNQAKETVADILLRNGDMLWPTNVNRHAHGEESHQPGRFLTRMSLFAGLFLSPEKADDFLDLQAELYSKRVKQNGIGWARAYYVVGILRSLPPVIWSVVRKILVYEIFSLGK